MQKPAYLMISLGIKGKLGIYHLSCYSNKYYDMNKVDWNLFAIVRTFTQVSIQWQDTDSMREELDDLQVFACAYFIRDDLISWLNEVIVEFFADFLEHKVGHTVEPACWDVSCKQVSY